MQRKQNTMKRLGLMPLSYGMGQFDNNYYDEVDQNSPSLSVKGKKKHGVDKSIDSSDVDLTRSDIDSPTKIMKKTIGAGKDRSNTL